MQPGALRLVLAATVVVAHYAMLSGRPPSAPIDGVAVNVFFALSGYWITRLWDTTYSTLPSPILTFFVSRAWRIYPLALIGSLAMLPLVNFPVSFETLLANAALISLTLQSHALNPPEWSLAVEVQFYLAAPLLLWLVQSKWWTLLLAALGAVSWTLLALVLIDTSLPAFLLFFLAGVLYARGVVPQPTPQLVKIGIILFLVFGVLANAAAPLRTDPTYTRFYTLVLTATVLPFAALTVIRRSSKTDRILGDLAFPVYVTHWPMFALMSLAFTHWVLPAVVGTAAVSWLLWVWVDGPSELRRRTFVARRKFDCCAGEVATDLAT